MPELRRFPRPYAASVLLALPAAAADGLVGGEVVIVVVLVWAAMAYALTEFVVGLTHLPWPPVFFAAVMVVFFLAWAIVAATDRRR